MRLGTNMGQMSLSAGNCVHPCLERIQFGSNVQRKGFQGVGEKQSGTGSEQHAGVFLLPESL